MTSIIEQKFSLKEVAAICGVSQMTIVREIKRRNLGFLRIGKGKGRLLVTESQLREYLESREHKPA